MRAAVAIPARLRSSRMPRKVLSDIGGQSMLRRTYQVAVEAGCGPVVILPDAVEVGVEARSFGAAVMLTEPAAALLTGSGVIETIFAIPGIGRSFVQSALNRDYTVVMGVVIVYAAMIILLNLAVDLIYGLLDPKVRHD